MPRETFLRHTLHNLGPLTTNFTAAPSCTNLARESDAAYVYGRFVDPENPHPRGGVACTQRPVGDECQPNGSKRDKVEGRGEDVLLYGIAYYSPGLQCPVDWTTVATTPTFLTSLLEPSETIYMCCPSNYAIDTFFYSWCISTVPPVTELGYSDFCYPERDTPTKTFSSLDGTRLTGGAVVGYKTGTITEYVHEMMQPAHGTYQADFVYATVPAMTMIYKDKDKESAGSTKTPKMTLWKLTAACLCAAALLGGL